MSPSKWGDIELHAGDVIEYVTVGGAGYGDPAERDGARVAADVEQGYVSPARAARLYGRAEARR
jgi:N-methylhydantoinase B/oxoprolinase/acetone carboxylase alpha subunit